MAALTLARDEVYWLFKHNSVNAPKGKSRPNPDDYNDNALPELIFLIVQLKGGWALELVWACMCVCMCEEFL